MSRPGDGMRPIDFPRANLTLGPPAGMGDCEPLRVERTERSFVSWWEPDELDRAALARDGVIRLEVFGSGHPPVVVGVALPEREASETLALAALRDHLQSLDEGLEAARGLAIDPDSFHPRNGLCMGHGLGIDPGEGVVVEGEPLTFDIARPSQLPESAEIDRAIHGAISQFVGAGFGADPGHSAEVKVDAGGNVLSYRRIAAEEDRR